MSRTAHRDTELLDVLVVDDEPDAREMLADFCAGQGFRVTMAQDGRAALMAIGRQTPAFPVVIADLNMPHADGFAVLEAARRAHASCYVILVTGYATIDAAVRAVKAGAYDFLAKPFALGQLEVILARIRDRMALEIENRQLSRQARLGSAPFESDDRLRALEARVAALEAAIARRTDRFAGSECQKPDKFPPLG